MAIPEQQSSPATALQMLVKKIELVAFYDELSSLVRSILKHNVLVIGGDMNAQIAKNRNNKYSLHNTSKRNGQHLTDFMIENRLTCLNTNYQKWEGKLWTYAYTYTHIYIYINVNIYIHKNISIHITYIHVYI